MTANIISSDDIYFSIGNSSNVEEILKVLHEQKNHRTLICVHIIYPKNTSVLNLLYTDDILKDIVDSATVAGIKIVFIQENSF